MASLEEPSISELLRSLTAKVDGMAEQLRENRSAQALYVTQEQRTTDKELSGLRHDALVADVAEVQAKVDARARLLWSSLASPVIVGVLVWLLTRGNG